MIDDQHADLDAGKDVLAGHPPTRSWRSETVALAAAVGLIAVVGGAVYGINAARGDVKQNRVAPDNGPGLTASESADGTPSPRVIVVRGPDGRLHRVVVIASAPAPTAPVSATPSPTARATVTKAPLATAPPPRTTVPPSAPPTSSPAPPPAPTSDPPTTDRAAGSDDARADVGRSAYRRRRQHRRPGGCRRLRPGSGTDPAGDRRQCLRSRSLRATPPAERPGRGQPGRRHSSTARRQHDQLGEPASVGRPANPYEREPGEVLPARDRGVRGWRVPTASTRRHQCALSARSPSGPPPPCCR